MFAGAADFTGLGKTVVDALPFGIAEVSCISHPKLVADFGRFKKLKITDFMGVLGVFKQALSTGLYGDYVLFAFRQLEQVERKNPIAWYVVKQVLLRIDDLWDKEPFTPERVERMHGSIQDALVRVVRNIDCGSVVSMEADLTELINRMSELFNEET